ncbi:hypothetical protein [Candidatus Electrothrix sp.]|uniref:hypothetical protein n=1 Tax=Candidatus Electrothrix sp. TaxID=2170559 RepID=UPI0040574FD3
MKTQATNKNEPRFTGEVVHLEDIGLTYDFSEDELAATLIFNKLVVHLWDDPGVFVIPRTVSLSIPVVHNDRNLRITQGISGFVSVDGPARAVLLVQAAGETTLVDLKEANDDGPEQENSYSFNEIIEGELRAGAAYHVTFFLLVERDVDHGETGGSLTIDSLDLEIKDPAEEG